MSVEDNSTTVDPDVEKDNEHTEERSMLTVIDSIVKSGYIEQDDPDSTEDEVAITNQINTRNSVIGTPIASMPTSLQAMLNVAPTVTKPLSGTYKHNRIRDVLYRRPVRVAQYGERRISFANIPNSSYLVLLSADRSMAIVVREVYLSTSTLGIDIQGYVVGVDMTAELSPLGNDGIIVETSPNNMIEITSPTTPWHDPKDLTAVKYVMTQLNTPTNNYSFYVPLLNINLGSIVKISNAHGGFDYTPLNTALGL